MDPTSPTSAAPANPAAPATPAAEGGSPGGTGQPAAPAPAPTGTPPPAADKPAGDQPSGDLPKKDDDQPASPGVAAAFARLNAKKAEVQLSKEERAELERLRGILAKAKEDPEAIESELGEDFFERLVTSKEKKGRPAKDPTEAERLAAVERELEERRAREREDEEARQRAEAKAAIDKGRTIVSDAVKAAGEKFETINALGKQGLVFDVMVEYAKQNNGATIPWEVAAAKVEKDLDAEEDERQGRLKTTKKFGSRYAQPAAPPPAAGNAPTSDKPNGAPANSGSPTLTSRMNGDGPPPSGQLKYLTREESLAEAMKLLKDQNAASAQA